MKSSTCLALAFCLATVSLSAAATQVDPHKGHHPAPVAATPASATPSRAASATPNPEVAKMDMQMKAMREMHEKMMAAKTPSERHSLMAEHMKTMQDSMAMMNGMSAGGMMGNMKNEKNSGAKDAMEACHQAMVKRMEMMQAMMQMIIDRLPTEPTNP